MSPMRDQLAFAALAVRRYPDVQPELAVMFLASDRRAAGLGALAKTQGRGNVRNRKTADPLRAVIHYTRTIDVPPRDFYEPFELGDLSISTAETTATITVTRRPAIKDCKAVQIDRRDFDSQSGRDMVARMLRRLRRATAKTTEAPT